MFSIKIMNIANKNYRFVLFILFVKCYYPYAWSLCTPLISTKTTNVTCTHPNRTLEDCCLPEEGTMACLSCNEFYEESTIEQNPCFHCKNDSWDAVIPFCYPICGKVSAEENFQQNLDTYSDSFPKYPWSVGIYHNITNQRLSCMGTLIAMDIVLADERCFFYSDYSEEFYNSNIFVASGGNYPQYLGKGDKFYQHSKIDKVQELIDTGSKATILVLSNPFVPSRVVQPICVHFYSDPISDNFYLPTNGSIVNWIYPNISTEIPVKFELCRACGGISLLLHHQQCILFDSDKICNLSFGYVVFKKSLIDTRYYVRGTLAWHLCDQNCTVFNSGDTNLNVLEKFVTNNRIRNCTLPNHPKHGEYLVINASNQSLYEIGQSVLPSTQVVLSCPAEANCDLFGNRLLTCSREGVWTPTPEKCIFDISQPIDNKTVLLDIPDEMNKPAEFDYIYIILIVAVIIFFFVALVAVIILKLKFNKRRELRRELKMAGLDCFQYGNLKRFNPELGIDGQAELLPYNINYEFPRDKLELGQQLGSGAFGIVLRAEAFGIILNEERTTVAVKMVKSIVDDMHMKALVSELKIMVHLGQHLNVVNLLGACTQSIIKRELLVIVEYCRFGNLYNYLLQNRSNYINQIDTLSGNIDYSFNSEDFRSVSAVHHNSSTSQESDMNNFSSLNSIENGDSELGDNRQDSVKLYTKDLISWSFQIARGMEYLASRKICHGDLAARNILLAENNIVKICDFGLAKRIYRTANYKKNKDCPLPMKWMAIESIRDLVFSTQSDVWSYGIVLWELFSLAQTPYPGMEPDDKLYQKLLEGYRMKSPTYAPKKIYQIMCDCWNIDPLSRPCFNQLAGTVGLLLEENIRQFYIDLNDPYLVMNTRRISKNHKDYLLMLSDPDAIETPKYLSLKSADLDVDQDGNI